MRPYWKGYLKLALVSCPIALHAACSTAERISFRQINKATGNRLRQQLIDEETREPVGPEHKGRGYEVAKGQYLIVEDEDLEAIEIESTHMIEIDSFVPRPEIDQRFFDTPYYVVPNEPVAQDAFAVIREAMRRRAWWRLGAWCSAVTSGAVQLIQRCVGVRLRRRDRRPVVGPAEHVYGSLRSRLHRQQNPLRLDRSRPAAVALAWHSIGSCLTSPAAQRW